MNGKYAMYLRKSRADDESPEDTLLTHEKILDRLAESKNLNVIKKYKEVVSGETIDNRPEMISLLDEVAEGKYDGVLVVEIERLARGNGIDQAIILETFKSTNTLIITPNKTYDPANEADEQFFELGLMLSRIEYKTIRKRMMRGRYEAQRRGQYCAKKPYGYDLVNKKLVINEKEAETVKDIFQLYASGSTVTEIIKLLKSRGIPSPSGKPVWGCTQVHSLLRNITYAGHIKYSKYKTIKIYNRETNKTTKKTISQEGEIIRNVHPAIIDENLYNECQEMKILRRHPKGHGKYVNPLGRILVCPKCGRTMRYENGRYFHNAEARRHGVCEEPFTRYTFNAKAVLDEVVSGLSNITEGMEIEMKKSGTESPKELKKKLTKELQELENKKLKLYDLFEDGIYSKDEFLSRRKSYESKIFDLKQNIDSIVIPDKKSIEDKIIKINEIIEKLSEDDVNAEDKNKFLNAIISRIEITPLSFAGTRVEGTQMVKDFRLDIYLR